MTSEPSQEFELYFVAFLDLLGFADMVKSDCESRQGSTKFMQKLLDIHERTLEICDPITNGLELVQFSDTVILAMPLAWEQFVNFLKIVSNFQYELFRQCLLCRGGIAYGDHFSKGTFMFSNGLIKAYNIEKNRFIAH